MSEIPSGILVRDAAFDDAPSMSALMTALSAEAPDTVSARLPPTADEQRDFIAAVQGAGGALLLAVDDGAVVGSLDVWPGAKPYNRHVCHFGMCVVHTHRNRGVGRALVMAAIERCRSWPVCCRLELEVVPWNAPAISLYRRLGFTVEATKRKAINLRGQPEDLILMALTW
jgi:RimJ/RimL family protein N-acetyltransferase